ncbi:MAG: response regulator [Candidatus Omnitrophica bacterium]|nr:response regulator [Candidatus Omnitrophota bacterium]MBD3269161.1 response regulator [Candidatus Omnitrophota bacterium]
MNPARKKILLVDDEKEMLEFLANFLQRNDYDVVFTSRGSEALQLAIESKPDLIVLDIVMPDIDGGELALLMSKEPAIAKAPIIFLTGIIRDGDELNKIKAVKDYSVVSKPLDPKKFLDTIKEALSA